MGDSAVQSHYWCTKLEFSWLWKFNFPFLFLSFLVHKYYSLERLKLEGTQRAQNYGAKGGLKKSEIIILVIDCIKSIFHVISSQ